MLLLVTGFVAIVLGVILARRGYAATRKRPYAASNGRLLLGAVIIGIGFALVICGTVISLILG